MTDEQKAVANFSHEAFVSACPGAGKTDTIVARLQRITATLPPRRGVAVLSFTNCAVDEFTRRCAKQGLAAETKFPNFIGTFDGFVRHFLVLPSGIEGCAVRPTVVDSWRNLGIEIRVRGAASHAMGVPLDFFNPRTKAINLARLGPPAFQQHVTTHRAKFEVAANYRLQGLNAAGYLNSEGARCIAESLIAHPQKGPALARALKARFAEIVVDEAQDCNGSDAAILHWLRGQGIPVTIVCDPDQAIYGFRENAGDVLTPLQASYPAERRLSLTGNFRSSPPITALAATLRALIQPDSSLGPTAHLLHRIVVATYTGRPALAKSGAVFLEQITAPAIGLTRADGIVLAHQEKDAHFAAGNPSATIAAAGDSCIERLAQSVSEFRQQTADDRGKEYAARATERLLLELLGIWQNADHTVGAVTARAKVDGRQLRRDAVSLLMNLPATCADSDDARAQWIVDAKSAFTALKLSLPAGQTIGKFLRSPASANWARHLLAPPENTMLCSTIHDAKGKEFEAVCLVLQPDRAPQNRTTELVTAWEARQPFEPKRVIYVGVTRAKQFVMLVVPDSHRVRCLALLAQNAVPYEHVVIA